MSNYQYLDKVNFPSDIKKLSIEELKIFSTEVRKELINAVSVTGGHLGAGLGVVELTVALHYIFDTPNDKLIWDVGHQTYPHKILTGRKGKIRTLRQKDGLSGFTKRTESEYDHLVRRIVQRQFLLHLELLLQINCQINQTM